MGNNHSFFSYTFIEKSLFYLLIIFLPTQLAKHYWLKSYLLQGLRVDYLSLKLSLLDILILLNLALIVFRYGFKIIFQEKKILTYFLAWTILQLLWVDLRLFHFYYSLKIFLSILLFANLNRVNYSHNKIFYIFLFQSLFLVTLSVLQIIREKSVGGLLYFLGERSFSINTPGIATDSIIDHYFLRPYATFPHPNTLAGYSILVFLYLSYIYSPKKHFQKVLTLLSKTLLFFIVVISFSQIALTLFLLIIFLRRIGFDIKKNLLLTTSIFVASFAPLLLMLFFTNSSFPEINIRNQIYWENFKHWPRLVLGSGFFSDIFLLFQNNILINKNFILQPIHNVWWFLALSVGLVPLVLFFVYFLKQLPSKINPLIIFSILLLGSGDHFLITQQQTFLMALFLFFESIYKFNLHSNRVIINT